MTNETVLHEWEDGGVRFHLLGGDPSPVFEEWWEDPSPEGGHWSPVDHSVSALDSALLPELARLADLVRPRDPARGELPEPMQDVIFVYEDEENGGERRRSVGWMDTPEWWASEATGEVRGAYVVCWWPAPALPSPEGAEGESEKEAT